jgi:hypothetical protein
MPPLNFQVYCEREYGKFILEREGSAWAQEFSTLENALEHARSQGGSALTVFNPAGRAIIHAGNFPPGARRESRDPHAFSLY